VQEKITSNSRCTQQKKEVPVIPAQAGIQKGLCYDKRSLDPSLRWDDKFFFSFFVVCRAEFL